MIVNDEKDTTDTFPDPDMFWLDKRQTSQ